MPSPLYYRIIEETPKYLFDEEDSQLINWNKMFTSIELNVHIWNIITNIETSVYISVYAHNSFNPTREAN